MALTLSIFAIGFFLRLFFIGNIPGNRGVYQDEAYTGYKAWSLLHYGHDSWGYAHPVYLTTWGTGMSVLQTLCEDSLCCPVRHDKLCSTASPCHSWLF